MSAKVTPILLLAVLLGCLAFSANCEGDYEERRPPGDGRRCQITGDRMTVRRSSSRRKMMTNMVAGACVKNTCEGSTCYCCQTVPTKPCFLELDACLRVCSGPLLAEPLPVSSSSAGRQQAPRREASSA
ncbi:hypothetical protein GQ55_1G083700 [Panicum hallii var. hallii]|uniref:Uncharacterized protein n=1 Tax=Panicum hallii var. hallii TaxID=1504633 RepID=A0A2T7F3L6_9POAL|nr:hypothetical protein GQ55_1G083700 [Panicum hallii var. hallii]